MRWERWTSCSRESVPVAAQPAALVSGVSSSGMEKKMQAQGSHCEGRSPEAIPPYESGATGSPRDDCASYLAIRTARRPTLRMQGMLAGLHNHHPLTPA